MVEQFVPTLTQAAWSVAALLRELSQALTVRFATCVVQGEISGFVRAGSGHCYFNLKDSAGESALIRCVVFRRCASLLDFTPADGQLIELQGRLGMFEPRGELQMVVEIMQRAGAGALYEQFMRLKAKLETQGWFAAQRKRALPERPRSVGVVTSLDAAALQDVLTTLARRTPHLRVVIYPSVVQGAPAVQALCDAMVLASQRAEVDVLIVCRGGGSLEDLWAFNEERVVMAVARAAMPVVCGIGHETDMTLCDGVADLRAPTPTAAAELVAVPTQVQLDELAAMSARLTRAVRHHLSTHAQRLDRASLQWAQPAQRLRELHERLGLLAQRMAMSSGHNLKRREEWLQLIQERLQRAVQALLLQRRQPLDALEARLQCVDPQHILKRGYAWLARPSGEVVTSRKQLCPGESLQAVLSDGTAEVRVTHTHPLPLG